MRIRAVIWLAAMVASFSACGSPTPIEQIGRSEMVPTLALSSFILAGLAYVDGETRVEVYGQPFASRQKCEVERASWADFARLIGMDMYCATYSPRTDANRSPNS